MPHLRLASGHGPAEWFALRDELNGIRLYELDPDVRCIVPTTL